MAMFFKVAVWIEADTITDAADIREDIVGALEDALERGDAVSGSVDDLEEVNHG